MNETIIGYIIIAIISILSGIFGTALYYNRDTTKFSRSDYQEGCRNNEEAAETIREIREKQRITK